MDNQNQLKTSLSGGHDSHGVYICHRCGWPFPNPHPSARHRRAHKKICGSIEGYKLFDSEGHIHLNASDDEHEQHSDEEHPTPSPKFEKRRISGDDVFSDAATEFPDSGISPAKEEHLESIAGSDKNVEKTVEADLNAGQLLKVDGIEDITKPLDSPSKSSQEPKVVETATTAPLKETSTEELGIPISSLNGSPIKSEIPMGSPKEIIPVNKEDDLDKMSATAARPPSKTVNEASEAELQLQDTDISVQGQSERSGLEIPKPDVESVELRETSIKTVQFSADSAEDIGVGSQGDSVELSDTKGEKKEYLRFHSAANHFPVDQPEVLIEDFIDHKEVKSDLMSLHDLPPQAESVEHLGASFDTVETKSDSAPRVCTDTESVEVCDTKGEDKEDFHVLSPADLPIVDQPEIMIQDFKDHKAVKSSLSLNLDSDEVIKTAEVGIEDAVQKEVILKQEGNKNNLVTEKPVEKEDESSDLKVTHGEDLGLNGLEALPDSSDVVPTVNSVDESRERDVELSAKVESEDSLCVSKADQISKSTGEYVGGEHENSRLEIESTGGETGKGNFATNAETKLDSASQLSELPSVDSVPDSTKVDFDPREVTKETESGIGTVATGSESNHTIDAEEVEKISMKHDLKEPTTLPIDSGSTTHVTDVEVAERKSVKPIFEETGPILVDSGLETKTSGTVDTNGSSVCYELKQDEGDDKPQQQVGASAVYVSVDSISQTDSLEGNWGSVSVLSVQSDAPANIDAEALPSNDSQAPTKSEDDFQKPKVGLEGSHSDKQEDDLEPPSYTTLVESEGCGVEPKAADFKTNTLQTSEKPNAKALQSGWFPSLTNVVNESQGRKKNEEVIAKVTNWSAGTAKEHSNLKNLLIEANADTKPKPPSPKQAPSSVSQKDENVSDVKAASIVCSEASADQVVKKETAKEWNSPARYPTEIKKEKRKAKGKPSWVPLFCCSSASVN